jgi:hypothetical protein
MIWLVESVLRKARGYPRSISGRQTSALGCFVSEADASRVVIGERRVIEKRSLGRAVAKNAYKT